MELHKLIEKRRIEKNRLEKGFTQKLFGEKVGLTQRAVSRFENGIQGINSNTLAKIFEVLGMKVILIDEKPTDQD